jgi:hypothetical protein
MPTSAIVSLIVVGLPALAMGIFCFYAGKKDVLIGLASRHWLSVIGVVQSVTPIRIGGTGSTGITVFRHRLYVRYFFDLAGKRHWGDWKTPVAVSLPLALKKAGPLEAGGPIAIYYCPDDPKLSVVEKGLTLERLGGWVAGSFVIAVLALIVAGFVYMRPYMK